MIIERLKIRTFAAEIIGDYMPARFPFDMRELAERIVSKYRLALDKTIYDYVGYEYTGDCADDRAGGCADDRAVDYACDYYYDYIYGK